LCLIHLVHLVRFNDGVDTGVESGDDGLVQVQECEESYYAVSYFKVFIVRETCFGIAARGHVENDTRPGLVLIEELGSFAGGLGNVDETAHRRWGVEVDDTVAGERAVVGMGDSGLKRGHSFSRALYTSYRVASSCFE